MSTRKPRIAWLLLSSWITHSTGPSRKTTRESLSRAAERTSTQWEGQVTNSRAPSQTNTANLRQTRICSRVKSEGISTWPRLRSKCSPQICTSMGKSRAMKTPLLTLQDRVVITRASAVRWWVVWPRMGPLSGMSSMRASYLQATSTLGQSRTSTIITTAQLTSKVTASREQRKALLLRCSKT